MSLKEKRERSTNFIESELELLVDLVVRHNKVLENKKTDAVTANVKNKTWELLAKQFNSKSLNGYRSEKCLKLKYENLKKTVKIKLRDVKSKPCPTGGGPTVPQNTITKLSSIEETIRSLNLLAFSGATSQFDSDCVDENMKVADEMGLQNNEYNNLMVEVLQDCQENNSEDLDNISDNITEINWSDYTPAKLRTPISSILSSTIIPQNHSCIDHTTNLYENETCSDKNLEIEKLQENQTTKINQNSVYRKIQASIINANKEWSEVAKLKNDVLELKKKLLEEELVFKRKENALKLEILTSELAVFKKKIIYNPTGKQTKIPSILYINNKKKTSIYY